MGNFRNPKGLFFMRISQSTTLRRGVAGVLTVTAIAAAQLAAAAAASAHVTVSAPGAAAGDWTVVTLKVPTESDTATTTKVEVTLPKVTSARTVPVPGWTAEITKNADGVATAITWTVAAGNKGIGADELELFPISLGPLPDAPSIEFPAVQTYSDGEVVSWVDPPKDDGTEPDHPAPVLELLPAADPAPGAAATATAPASVAPSVAVADDLAADSGDSSDSDNTARVLGGIGLLLGAAALAVTLARGRKPSAE